jgi:uncharacterized membrane protein YbhN (UPF0104 family)
MFSPLAKAGREGYLAHDRLSSEKPAFMSAPSWKRHTKLVVKLGLAILILVALGRHVEKTWRELQTKHESVHVDPAFVALGGVLYLAGLTAFGIFYGQVMKASPSPIPLYPAIRAYLISHLGKYVPGKAMVVITRVGLSTPFGARPATAAFATFYETLVMMAGGSVIAAIGFASALKSVGAAPVIIGALLATAFLGTVEPRIFPRITRLVTSPFPSIGTEALPFLSHRLMFLGLLWSVIGWTLLGLSQVAVARAVVSEEISPRSWPLIVASVALATVAGFVVAILPAGLGVREGVLMSTLTPVLGVDKSVVAALLLRLTWVVVESLAAAGLAAIRPKGPGPVLETSVRSSHD